MQIKKLYEENVLPEIITKVSESLEQNSNDKYILNVPITPKCVRKQD